MTKVNKIEDQNITPMQNGIDILIDSTTVSYEKLPMLEVTFDRLVRYLTTSLRNFTSDNVEVSMSGISSARLGEYLEGLKDPAIISVVKIKEWNSSFLIVPENNLVFTVLDVLLGLRNGQPNNNNFEGRRYTSIETALVERFIKVILHDFNKSFEPIAIINFALDRIELIPKFAQIDRPSNAAIIAEFQIHIDGRGGLIKFVIPYASLEPAREKLLGMFVGEKQGKDTIWENHLSGEVWSSEIKAQAILDCISMKLSDVVSWKVGSKFSLQTSPDSKVDMFVGNKKILTGKVGKKRGCVAIQIENNFIRDL